MLIFWSVDVNEAFESISLTQVVFVSNKMKLKNFRKALTINTSEMLKLQLQFPHFN